MKDEFAVKQGYNSWIHALEQIVSTNNEYILDNFITDYLEFILTNNPPKQVFKLL